VTVAADITLIASVGDERVLYADQYDDATVTASLRVRAVGNDNTLGAAASIPIADHVESYSIIGPTPDTLVYTVAAGGTNDGVYVRWFVD
jgi:hypothetical protein